MKRTQTLDTIVTIMLFSISSMTTAQSLVSGVVTMGDVPAAFAMVTADGLAPVTAGVDGKYAMRLAAGRHTLIFTYVGAEDKAIAVEVDGTTSYNVDILLQPSSQWVDDIVITGTKTFKHKTNSPISVQVLSRETLMGVQACNISEGLSFQPGLRVEVDCQTCNYSQLRINGLAGGYSQILINGRPIFSPLTGMYGLEQLPTNMIDRIEVVRGGGSSLYGSSAIAGTVNILTSIPKVDQFSIGHTQQVIGNSASDSRSSATWTNVTESGKAGVSVFANYRIRDFYDDNEDSYSELPYLRTASIGASSFWLPSDREKIEVSGSYINEYRLGGEMRRDIPSFQLGQGEERQHHVYTGSIDYQLNSDDKRRSLIAYVAAQHTDRDHYTGLLPSDPAEREIHLAIPPVGVSRVTTINSGVQVNADLSQDGSLSNILTLGAEILVDNVYDEISAYNYLIDQSTTSIGLFGQSDWQITDKWNLLTGLRIDHHNLVDRLLVNPRLALMYKPTTSTRLRLSYGTGFRAPQAFDADLHIAFAGGGISRVQLSPELAPEQSQSWSASLSHDVISERYIIGFTLETFYTRLADAFFLQPIGQDAFGEVFEKQNSKGATVGGSTIELRANYDRKIQLETGLTWQQSRFDSPVQYIDDLPGVSEFVRTPDWYGFATLSYTPESRWSSYLSYVYTGSMLVPHFAGSPSQLVDEIFTSSSFHDLQAKVSYVLPVTTSTDMSISLGCRNIFNAYQHDFDIGPNRDSNYIYGPALPRTFFLAVVING